MSTRDPALIQEFANEVSEHIENCEQILVRPESEPPSADEVNLLFRGFHSVKGLARVVNLHPLESLAHESESLLATVRSGSRPFSESIQNLLLQALDSVKKARADLMEGKEFELPGQLLGELKAALGAPSAAQSEAAPPQVSHPNADLYFDSDTLVAQGELFEELLPEIARGLVNASQTTKEQIEEDFNLLLFASNRIQLPALSARIQAASEERTPLAFAHLLVTLENYRNLVGQSCGIPEASLVVRSWFRESLHEHLGTGRLIQGLPLLEILSPGNPFQALLPAIKRSGISAAERAELETKVLEAIRTDVETDATQTSPAAKLVADQIRERLLARHLPPEALQKQWDFRKLDPERIVFLPEELVGRVPSLSKVRNGEFYEILLPLPSQAEELSALSGALEKHFSPWFTERAAVDSTPCIAVLVFTSRREDQIKALLSPSGEAIEPLVIRKLDGKQAAAHFGLQPKAASGQAQSGAQVRVPVELLDSMFGRIGQFFSVSSRFNAMVYDGQAHDILRELADYCSRHAPQLLPKVDWLVRQQNDFASLEAESNRLISMIHETTLGLRVIPLDTLFNRFPRMVRDTAQKQKKLVRFDARSKGIRVDNGMVELLADPLMHMLRNSVDHGIEPPEDRVTAGKPRTATLTLTAEQRGNRVVVEICDDGRGINIERVRQKAIANGLVGEEESRSLSDDQIARFIFTPGFSTAEKITDTSGRGVGMDVALVNVTKLGGKIEIHTRAGIGTTFRLDMPLSKAIQPMLLAETGVQTVAFPDRMVVEGTLIPVSELQNVNGQPSVLLHDRFLPVFRLVDLLQLPVPKAPKSELMSIIVCQHGGRRVGIEVNKILRRNDMLIQEMHPRIAHLPGIGGISTLGTDRIVIVIDPDGLFDLARRSLGTGLRNHPASQLSQAAQGGGSTVSNE